MKRVKYHKLQNQSINDDGDGDDNDDILYSSNKNNNNNNNNKRGDAEMSATKKSIILFIHKYFYYIKHLLQHTYNNNKRNKLSYMLGFSACFLVVFIVSLCVSIISNTPVVFLNLSEVSVGEIDMLITSSDGYSSLNYTLTESLLDGDQQNTYHAPRIYGLETTIVNANQCGDKNPQDNFWKYEGFTNGSYNSQCFPFCFNIECKNANQMTSSTLYVIDTAKEERIGLGRDWSYGSIPYGSVYLQSDLAGSLGVSQGDYVYLSLSVNDFIQDLFWNANITSFEEYGFQMPNIILTAKVDQIFSKSGGKYGKDETDIIMMEYDQLLKFVISQLDPLTPASSINFLTSSNLYDYSDDIIINLPPSRLEPYINSNQDTILNNLIQFSSKILYKVGFNQLDSQLPVMSELSKNRYVALFLGLILNVIIFILLFLSILLIYSLLMIDVETRTFEMGVMRMIGTTRSGIIQLMLCKAFSYSLPSWVFGLVFAQIFGFGVSKWFATVTGVPIPPKLTGDGVLLATLLGMFIPVAASIFPIRNALGKNLHDSLDVRHSKSSAVQITIERSEDNSFATDAAIVGFILAAFGFGIYYIFPLSLLSFNLALLLNMFFLLLIAMLLGLVLLALNVEHLLEILVVRVFLFWERKAIPAIVIKNLVAHKLRNRKTAIMYAVSLAFIIFVNVSYSTQQASMNYKVLQQSGSYIRLDAQNHPFTAKQAQKIEEFLLQSSKVRSFAWISKVFNSVGSTWAVQTISNIGHIYSDTNNIYGISPNYFEVALADFLKVDKVTSDPDYNLDHKSYLGLSEQMYSLESSNTMVVGSLYESMIGASLGSPFLLKSTVNTNMTGSLVQPMALINSAPGFTFSQFPSVTNQDALLSFPNYLAYAIQSGSDLKNGIDSVRKIEMNSLIIQQVDNSDDVETLKNSLDSFISNNVDKNTNDYSIFDYKKEIEPNQTASNIIEYFFSFTTVIAMVISFFSLMSSMFTNIFEQTKEIGILRAIGIPKIWMMRIYVYESFVLVLSSSLLGVIIGSVVGYTMILQRVLFTQLPIPFVFPWQLLLVIFGCSFIFSLLSAFIVRKVLNQPVINIMRIVT